MTSLAPRRKREKEGDNKEGKRREKERRERKVVAKQLKNSNSSS